MHYPVYTAVPAVHGTALYGFLHLDTVPYKVLKIIANGTVPVTVKPLPYHPSVRRRFTALPVGLDEKSSGIEFFPEIASEAAPEVAKGLIHVFTKHLGGSEFSPFGPSGTLSTDDQTLARAVGTELRELGVSQIKVDTKPLVAFAQRHFEDTFQDLKKRWGATGQVAQLMFTPESIGFQNFRSWDLQTREPEADEFDESVQLLTDYMRALYNACPALAIKDLKFDPNQEAMRLRRLFGSKHTSVVEEEADAGIAGSQLDFALGLQVGIDCEPDRQDAREYFVKAAMNESATGVTRSIAHALLMNWYMKSPDLRTRNIFFTAHHANQSLIYSDGHVSPSLLHFAEAELQKRVQMGELPVLSHMYELVWKARKKRQEELEVERAMAQKKRLVAPNRYRCAAVGCDVEANRGKVLSQCAGQCDKDKKPSYCSKECQRGDWKNHKPFCKPGMPCSVVDEGAASAGLGQGTKQGILGVPIPNANGNTNFLSTSTLGPEELREMRDLIRGMAPEGISRNFQMDRWELDY
ncbi:hypothetical protein Moror_3957 [Moniliophthora roreri MCA 2997]|uniref:MYND-type domain-containing protein n=1 Tax=Moniliophthora roreri (strain MCA 2997) TaxID=1381753 RepID=V2YUE4_MONRO|nr:hypothetical protein Moror_3957 [Moniliophthora roreri MCA 2997]